MLKFLLRLIYTPPLAYDGRWYYSCNGGAWYIVPLSAIYKLQPKYNFMVFLRNIRSTDTSIYHAVFQSDTTQKHQTPKHVLNLLAVLQRPKVKTNSLNAPDGHLRQ